MFLLNQLQRKNSSVSPPVRHASDIHLLMLLLSKILSVHATLLAHSLQYMTRSYRTLVSPGNAVC